MEKSDTPAAAKPAELPRQKQLDLPSRLCMRSQSPRQWTHKTQSRDNRTVAVWCGCADCRALDSAFNRREVT